MNRANLIAEISKATGFSRKSVAVSMDALFATISGALARGERVTLVGFGTFERRIRKKRTGRHPRTHQPLSIAAAKVPSFRASSKLKVVVARGQAPVHAGQKPLPGEFQSPLVEKRCKRCGRIYTKGVVHVCDEPRKKRKK